MGQLVPITSHIVLPGAQGNKDKISILETQFTFDIE